jgi:hypothetical protein
MKEVYMLTHPTGKIYIGKDGFGATDTSGALT